MANFRFLANFRFPTLYMLTRDMVIVKCSHSFLVKCSRYKATSVSDPNLADGAGSLTPMQYFSKIWHDTYGKNEHVVNLLQQLFMINHACLFSGYGQMIQ